MSEAIDHGTSRLAILNLSAAALHVAAALALLTLREPGSVVAPVQLSLYANPSPPFAAVDLVAAFAVVALIAAAARVAVLIPGLRQRFERGLRDGRHGIRWIEYSQTAGITAFLVAQINGVAEAGALILVYAISAGAVLLLWIQDRSTTPGARGLLAFSVGAAIGIVPWGVIALYHIVGLLFAPEPGLLFRLATLGPLIIAAAHWASVWLNHQRRGPWASPLMAERGHIGLSLALSGVFVALVLLAPFSALEEWAL